jgi:hypothetical protein
MRFNFKSAVWGGIVSTLVMSFVMGLFGMNLIKVFGFAAGTTGTLAYFIGGIIHFLVGIFYALIYALIFEPLLKKLPRFLAGALFGLVPFIVFMLLATSSLMSLGAAVPCSPCGGLLEDNPPVCAPCNPCTPCNPEPVSSAHRTSSKSLVAAAVPCAPGGGLLENNPPAIAKPETPPQAGQGWLMVLINYVVYGIVLGLVYRPKIR